MRRSILTFVLCTLCLCPLFSQEAFYIYRNDGDFNGFFYDEVVEMRYSKLALDSVEYEYYVTYDIETADSTYRIPLTVIDSISFVQPEIIFNEKLRHMDFLGMTPYVLVRDSQTLTFSSQIPDSLMPQIGDVLVGFTGILEEGGFGGRVTSVARGEEGIIVQTDELTQLSDIFVQFITIEQAGIPTDHPDQVVYRMAGLNKAPQLSGATNNSLFNIHTNLHLPFKIKDVPIDGSFDASVFFLCKETSVFQVTSDYFYYRSNWTQEYGLTAGVTLSSDATGEMTIPLIPEPFSTFKIPANLPLFEIRPIPQMGVRWGGQISGKLALPTVSGRLSETFVFDTDAAKLTRFKFDHKPFGDDLSGIFSMGGTDLEFQFMGYTQIGLKEELALSTNSWFSKVFWASTGIDIWLGPKLEGSVNISGQALVAGDGPYTLADSHIDLATLSLDAEIYSKVSCFGKEDKTTWIDGSFDALVRKSAYLLPKFNKITAEYSANAHIMDAELFLEERIPFWPGEYGIVMFKMDSTNKPIIADSKYTSWQVFRNLVPMFEMRTRTKNMKAGTYQVAPSLKIFNGEYPVYSMAKQVTLPLEVEMDPIDLHFDAQGFPTQFVSFTTNCPMDGIIVDPGSWFGCPVLQGEIIAEDSVNGVYQLKCYALPNDHLFTDSIIEISAEDYDSPAIRFNVDNSRHDTAIHIGFSQDANNLSQMRMHFDGWFVGTEGSHRVYFSGPVKARREMYPDRLIIIEDTIVEGDLMTIVNITLMQDTVPCPECEGQHFYASGSLTRRPAADFAMLSNSENFSFEFAEGRKTTVHGTSEVITGASYIHTEVEQGEDGEPQYMEYANFLEKGHGEYITIHFHLFGDEEPDEQ